MKTKRSHAVATATAARTPDVAGACAALKIANEEHLEDRLMNLADGAAAMVAFSMALMESPNQLNRDSRELRGMYWMADTIESEIIDLRKILVDRTLRGIHQAQSLLSDEPPDPALGPGRPAQSARDSGGDWDDLQRRDGRRAERCGEREDRAGLSELPSQGPRAPDSF